MRFPAGVQETLDGQLDGLAERIEGCPTGCCCTPRTARRRRSPLTERGLQPETVLVRRSTLEDVFLRLTGRRLID